MIAKYTDAHIRFKDYPSLLTQRRHNEHPQNLLMLLLYISLTHIQEEQNNVDHDLALPLPTIDTGFLVPPVYEEVSRAFWEPGESEELDEAWDGITGQ